MGYSLGLLSGPHDPSTQRVAVAPLPSPRTPTRRSRRSNCERAFTEGNRVLAAPQFSSRIAIAGWDIGAGENGRSTRTSRSNVLTRPRPEAEQQFGSHSLCLFSPTATAVDARADNDPL